ncbi:MAG TPA: hypothetical protein VD887_12365 [Allosphingosinicella sp.]|nr:hypothetical protein [Allosphingosinicella sp.]HYG30991.1 hypothetical protein [Allosphingosinicella sp.]
MRIGPALAALALASCGGGEDETASPAAANGAGPNENVSAAAVAEDCTIECAIGGGPFERSCTIERHEGREGLRLTIRNADGGFRRLLLPRDGSGAVAADGAERAQVRVIPDGRAEVSIAGDRYRLPPALGPDPQ